MGEPLDIRGAIQAFRLLNETPEPEATPEPAKPQEEGKSPEPEKPEPEKQEPEKAEVSEGVEEQPEEQVKSIRELADHLEVDPEYLYELMVEAKVDGNNEPVPLRDVLANYQKSAAADKRLKEVAEAKKAFEAEKKAQIEQVNMAKAVADQVLESQWSQIQEQEKAIESLKDDDPAEYASRMISLQRAKEGIKSQYEKLQNEYQRAIQLAQIKAIEENSKRLPELIPEWSDSKKADSEKKAISEYLSRDFQAEEISGITDARFVALARKAMLFDQLQEQSRETVRKVKTLPKRLAGGPAKGADAARQEELKKLSKQHKQSGSIASALALYKARRGS